MSVEKLYQSIVRGFYPARWEIEGEPIENYFSNYMKTYLDRDVSQLIALKDKVKFENLLRVLASLKEQEFIPDNIAKTIGVDIKTVNYRIIYLIRKQKQPISVASVLNLLAENGFVDNLCEDVIAIIVKVDAVISVQFLFCLSVFCQLFECIDAI